MKMMRNLITVSGTLPIKQYWQPLQQLRKNTKRLSLIDVIDDLTRHSYIVKLKITSSWYRTKSKKYCKLHSLVVYYLRPDGSFQHDSLCFRSDDNNLNSSDYTSFLYQTMLVYYLRTNLLLWQLWMTLPKLQELYGFVFP